MVLCNMLSGRQLFLANTFQQEGHNVLPRCLKHFMGGWLLVFHKETGLNPLGLLSVLQLPNWVKMTGPTEGWDLPAAIKVAQDGLVGL